ncbi:MAG: hypothetical protein ACOYJL_03270 [Tractidigestivibacter sp.]|jgi:hypothetical protein|uniref:hypothetical protein n=1 Tax=Tractidigestivibacter sp. TaxID=2847320 RepID=UPI003D8AD67B
MGGQLGRIVNGLDLIQVDGYAFKDLNRNGKLDLWEDWRQTPEDRAAALSQELPLELCEGLIIHETTNSLNEDATDAVVETDDGDQSELERMKNFHFRTILDRSVQSGSGTVNAHQHAEWVNIAQAAAEAEDTPRDMTVYVDSEGNAYDFAFGMNWSGVIDDDRVKTYKVSPILTPENLE